MPTQNKFLYSIDTHHPSGRTWNNNSNGYRFQLSTIKCYILIIIYTSVLLTRIGDVIFRINRLSIRQRPLPPRRRKIVQSETYWIDVLCVYVKRTKSTTIDKKGEKPFASKNFSAPKPLVWQSYIMSNCTYDKNNIIIITVRTYMYTQYKIICQPI